MSIDNSQASVEPVATGTVMITASVALPDGDDDPENDEVIEAKQDVEIVEAGVPMLAIALATDDDDASIAIDESTALTVIARFGSAEPVDVTELAVGSSSDEAIAVVSNVTSGNVTAVAAGAATITARYRGATADFTVMVAPTP